MEVGRICEKPVTVFLRAYIALNMEINMERDITFFLTCTDITFSMHCKWNINNTTAEYENSLHIVNS